MISTRDIKNLILRQPLVREAWGGFRRGQLHRDYLTRRKEYARAIRAQGVSLDERRTVGQIRRRLAARGWRSVCRRMGEIHTFAYVPRLGWHSALLPDLHELGVVTEFDYTALGYGWPQLFGDRTGMPRREMCARALSAVRETHHRRPVDWMFVYGNGADVEAEMVRTVTRELGIPVVNMCLDDKQSWTGPRVGSQRFGQVDIAAAFDLSWTSATVARGWYVAEGARPIYMPEGFDARMYAPKNVAKDIGVSFIGGAYGFRPAVIRHLRENGIPVQTFGSGWGTRAVWGEEQVDIINRSRINLGMGGIGYSERLTNVKTRDFEIPGTGGGVYLTSYNSDLAQHFEVGREILCYRNQVERLQMLRHYLERPAECLEIASRARNRCLKEHRWLHRYQKICRILGILESTNEEREEDDSCM